MTPENEGIVRAYRVTFGSPSGQEVMQDLMKFCSFRIPIENERDEGKRQVFLRIMNFLALTPEQLIAIYSGRHLWPKGEEE